MLAPEPLVVGAEGVPHGPGWRSSMLQKASNSGRLQA